MKQKKTPEELVKIFWDAPEDALFREEVIAAARSIAVSTLQKERFQDKGPRYIKVLGTILYRKSDVIAFIESFKE